MTRRGPALSGAVLFLLAGGVGGVGGAGCAAQTAAPSVSPAAPGPAASVRALPVTPLPVTPLPVTPQPVTPQPVTPQPVTPQPVIPPPATPLPVGTARVTALTFPPSPAGPSPAGRARAPKVLVVGLDGVRHDRMLQARVPYLREMMSQGTFATGLLELPKNVRSVSGPGWATVLTGVEPDKHGVRDNSFTGRQFSKYPDFLTRMEMLRPDLSTIAVAAWKSLVSTGAVGGLVDWHATGHSRTYARGVKDRVIVRRMAEILRTRQVDVAFVHLETVDGVAHKMGATSDAYLAAIEDMDSYVGTLFAAIRARPRFAAEDWTVIVTTDHGHKDQGGHGGTSMDERAIFVLAAGPGIAKGELREKARQVDVAATVFAQMGLEPPEELDGKSLSNKPINRSEGGASRTNK